MLRQCSLPSVFQCLINFVLHKYQVILDPIVTFPLVLGPDPCTAVVVDPVEHLSHPAEVPAPIHREEKEDGTLMFRLFQNNHTPIRDDT